MPPPPSFAALTAVSLKIGLFGFGGPAGQIALMHREFVERRQWIGEARYLHALNFCMLLPGPEAQQLATYVGWMLHGVRGGVVSGLLFLAPGAVLVTALSWIYAVYGSLPLVSALFFGIKAAVLALVAEALVRIGRRALNGPGSLALAVGAFVALFVFGVPFPAVMVAAALFGAVAGARGGSSAPSQVHDAQTSGKDPGTLAALGTAAVWLAVWLTPLGLLAAVFGRDAFLVRVGELFSVLAAVSFGGAYAVLAYLQQEAVNAQGWLSTGQMIDGLGLAETTPGPLVLVNLFVGFMAGWQTEGGGVWLALGGAAMAAWCTFAPSFVWIFVGAPYAEALRASAAAAGALRAVTAAVLGVIANLALWFALHVVFAQAEPLVLPWGHTVEVPVWSSLDVTALTIAALAALSLMRFKMPVAAVVGLAALAGAALRLPA